MESFRKFLALLIALCYVSQSWAFQLNFFSNQYAFHSKKGITRLSSSTSGYAMDQRVGVCPLVVARNKGRAAPRVTVCSATAGGLSDTKGSSEMIFSEYSQISGGEIQVHQMAQGSNARSGGDIPHQHLTRWVAKLIANSHA
jgi:hypothetical protein